LSEEGSVKFTVGSLFAGIGGIDLGFERQGFKTSWQVEIDPYCQKVLAKNFPEAKRYGDIRECGKHNLEHVDVLCGGFPCQDISNAGKRAGIEGQRSGLWSEYARIIGELRPNFALIENVAALLGRGLVRVLCDLTALGYDAEWTVLSAADVGAPHLRERVWIVAYPSSSGLSKRIMLGGIQGEEKSAEKRKTTLLGGTSIFDSENNSAYSAGVRRYHSFGFWRIEPRVGRVAHGVPKRVDRLRGLGNAVVPQCVEPFARQILIALEKERPPCR
jgi:DNA (cytosine-5)-methyltransferase 1